jgi:hypothetical protein
MQTEPNLPEKWYAADFYEKLSKPEAFLAFNNLRLYVNGVVKQWSRIRALSEELFKIPFGTLNLDSDQGWLFLRLQQARELDIHLYVTCWNGVRRHFKDFVKKDGDPAIRMVWAEIKELLEKIRPARDFFEHLEERELQGKSFQFSKGGRFQVSYFERKPKSYANRWVSVGSQEVERLLRAFDRVVWVIQAREARPVSKGAQSSPVS